MAAIPIDGGYNFGPCGCCGAIIPCDCPCFTTGYYGQLTLVVGAGSFSADIDCDCAQFEGTFILKYRGDCTWSTDETIVPSDCLEVTGDGKLWVLGAADGIGCWPLLSSDFGGNESYGNGQVTIDWASVDPFTINQLESPGTHCNKTLSFSAVITPIEETFVECDEEESPMPPPPTMMINPLEQKKRKSIGLNVIRPNKCEFLQQRTENKAGCNGWKCRHDCEKGLPAVPGVYCQTCPEYVDSEEKF